MFWLIVVCAVSFNVEVKQHCLAGEQTKTPVQIVTGPWLQAATETSIVIMWETSEAVPGVVEFGEAERLDNEVASKPMRVAAAETDKRFKDESAILHEVKLSGLSAGRTYSYRVRMGNAVRPTYTLRTNKQRGPFKFLTTSNTHAFERGTQRKKMEIMAKIPVDFVINQGDQTQQSMNKEYRKQMQGNAASSATTVWYTTRGNHENRTWSRYTSWYHNEFPGHRDESFYSFDIGDMHFTVLDEAPTKKTFPIDWFRDDLRRTNKKWKVILAKKPPHLFGKTYLYDLFQECEVDVMLAADCGTRSGLWPQPYEGLNAKYKGVWYLTNCGGYQVIETDGDTWNVETFDEEGNRRDKTRIAKD